MVQAPQPRNMNAMALAMKPSARVAHGNSLQARPARVQHPVYKNRDIGGRLMPGATLPGAAPPFQSQMQGPMPNPRTMAMPRGGLTPPMMGQ